MILVSGCSGGGGPFHAVFLGDHRGEPMEEIQSNLDVGFFDGTLHNLIIDGASLKDLTDEEREVIRDAYKGGFILLFYEMNDALINFLYKEILDHPNIYAEEDGGNTNPGNSYDVFTIENHHGLDWTSQSQSLVIDDELELASADPPEISGSVEFNPYTLHAFHNKQWIESQDDRRAELESRGLPAQDSSLLRTASQEGTLLDLATAWVQTSQIHIGFSDSRSIVDSSSSSATEINTYQMTTKAWAVTSNTPTGLNSFLLVNQDFNLASTNGFLVDSSTQKAWYLSEFKNVNTLLVNSSSLDVNDAQLIDEGPETNQATTTTESISVSTSISGTVGADQDGASAAISGGVSWGTDTTFSKANVSINNLSLSETTLGNDASWQYLPRKAEAGPDDGCVNTIYNLADLSHTTFTPSQAFIYKMDGSFSDKTLVIKTHINFSLTNTYRGDCNIFGCDCDANQQTYTSNAGEGTFTQSVHIPAAPE